jgi:hypothetical protein
MGLFPRSLGRNDQKQFHTPFGPTWGNEEQIMKFNRLSNASRANPRCPTRHLGTIHPGLAILLLLVAHCCAIPVLGQQPASSERHESRIVKPSEKASVDVRALVEALANRNPVPNLVGKDHPKPIFEKKVDWLEDDRVWMAIPVLVRNAEDAWPEMVKHIDDQRYCITLETTESGITYNWTVGDMCRYIVAGNLAAAYHRNLRPLTEQARARLGWPKVARDRKKLKAWCEERSKKQLYELQIDSCQWAITELRALDGYTRVSRIRARAWIAAIEAEIESLQESKQAVAFGGFGAEEFTPYFREKAERIRAEPPEKESPNAREMVEALANRNPVPDIVGKPSSKPIFDKKYDWSEYDRVWDGIQQINSDLHTAWPELVGHLDDGRYCITLENGDGIAYNWTVGDVCREIVAANLAEAYRQDLPPLTEFVEAKLRSPEVARDKKKLKAWCEERSKKELYELQIEMCEWAKSELRKPEDLRVSRLRVRAWIAAIDAEIESLQKSGEAEPFRAFDREGHTPYTRERAEKLRSEYLRDGKQLGGSGPSKKPAPDEPGFHEKLNLIPHVMKWTPEEPDIPKTADIEKIVVEVYGSPWPPLLDIGSFELPRKDYDKVLDFFRHPAQIDETAFITDEQESGTIRVIFPGRRSLRLCWFDTSNSARFSFSCGGMRYQTTGAKFTKDQAAALDTLIREIHKHTR